MRYFVYGLVCDALHCTEVIERQDIKLRALERLAREQGWAVSSTGAYCPEHRSRAKKEGR